MAKVRVFNKEILRKRVNISPFSPRIRNAIPHSVFLQEHFEFECKDELILNEKLWPLRKIFHNTAAGFLKTSGQIPRHIFQINFDQGGIFDCLDCCCSYAYPVVWNVQRCPGELDTGQRWENR